MLEAFGILRPQASSHPLVRIGNGRDGTYLVPDDLDRIAACFSPGVNNFKTFEDILSDRYDIPCHLCDHSSDASQLATPLKPGKQTFLKKWLEPQSSDIAVTLDEWVNGVAPEGDLLLQMDIEGAEYRNILGVSDATLARFRIIVVELHALGAMRDAAILRDVIGPFLRRLAGSFITVHAHPNNFAGTFPIPGTSIHIPNLLELTLIRKDRVVNPTFAPALPHPLDIGRNVRGKPPIFLGEAWFDGPRPLESRIRILEDRLDAIATLDLPQQSRAMAATTEMLSRSVATLTRRLVPASDAEPLQEVAEGCPYVLTSPLPGRQQRGVVTAEADVSIQAQAGPKQSIDIDLGVARDIRRIRVGLRTDARRDGVPAVFAVLSAEDGGEDATFPLTASAGPVGGDTLTCDADIPVTTARHVRFVAPAEATLHVSGIRVHAKVVAD